MGSNAGVSGRFPARCADSRRRSISIGQDGSSLVIEIGKLWLDEYFAEILVVTDPCVLDPVRIKELFEIRYIVHRLQGLDCLRTLVLRDLQQKFNYVHHQPGRSELDLSLARKM